MGTSSESEGSKMNTANNDEGRSPVDGHYYSWANPSNSAADRKLAAQIRHFIIRNFDPD